MKTLIASAALVAALLALPAAAQWRDGGHGRDPHYRTAHYLGPGFGPGDRMAVELHWEGTVPLAEVDFRRAQPPFVRSAALPGCDGRGNIGDGASPEEECRWSQWDGAYLTFLMMIDFEDQNLAPDVINRVSAFGLKSGDTFHPLAEERRGLFPGVDGKKGELQYVCYESFFMLSLGMQGKCDVGGKMTRRFAVVYIEIPMGRLHDVWQAVGPARFAVQMQRKSGAAQSFTYASEGMMDALLKE